MTERTKASRRQEFWERNRRSGGYLFRSIVKRRALSFMRGLLLFGLCFMILQPLLNKISISFMAQQDLYDTTVVVLPRNATLVNYSLASHLMDFPKTLLNTFWITLASAILQVAACMFVGYGFARFEFPLKKLWFGFVLLVIIVPPQTISSALYVNFQSFDVFGIIRAITGSTINLRGQVTPYLLMCATCMGLKDGLYIYMLRQYFRGVPKSLEEAAYVDGCGSLHTFVRVMLPDALPILVSCFLFAFVWQWTDSFYTRNFMSGTRLLSSELSSLIERLSRYLQDMYNTSGANIGAARQQQMVSTGVLMSITPLIVLYCFAQRGFVESLSSTGIKM